MSRGRRTAQEQSCALQCQGGAGWELLGSCSYCEESAWSRVENWVGCGGHSTCDNSMILGSCCQAQRENVPSFPQWKVGSSAPGLCSRHCCCSEEWLLLLTSPPLSPPTSNTLLSLPTIPPFSPVLAEMWLQGWKAAVAAELLATLPFSCMDQLC